MDPLGSVLAMRVIVGRYGEVDLAAWWDSEALSPQGQEALRQICPRTAAWRGMELVVLAARRRHLVGLEDATLTLFDFGASVEGALRHLALSLQEQSKEMPGFGLSETLSSAQSDLGRALTQAGRVPVEKPPLGKANGQTAAFRVGSIGASELGEHSVVVSLAAQLAWAYTDLPPGQLKVPYVEIRTS